MGFELFVAARYLKSKRKGLFTWLTTLIGVAGVTNFGFIIFQAAGAYTAAICSLPAQAANGGFQSYIGGWNLPWPVPWIGAMIVGGLIALPFTFLVGRRLRGDFAAVGLLVTAVMANLLVTLMDKLGVPVERLGGSTGKLPLDTLAGV